MTSRESLADILERIADGVVTPADLAALGEAVRARKIRVISNVGGRPEIDDAAALREVAVRVADGEPLWAAARAVARAYPGHNAEATAARLARKHKDAEKTSFINSVSFHRL
jgi:hypothetical protein